MPFLDQLFGCVAKGDLNRLISLLNKSPAIVNSRNEDGINLLQYTVLQDQVSILLYLANIAECQLAQSDVHYEHTALHTACVHDCVKMVQTIAQRMKPSEVNAQDKFGWTALHHAARNGNIAICKLLLQHNSQADIRNELGKTAVHYAAQHGYLDIVKLLYDNVPPSSIIPNPTEKFSLPVLTLMHLAAMNDHSSVVNWLQSKLYPPNIKCRRALHQNGDITSEELPEETAMKRGHLSLKANIQTYHIQYERWLQDIIGDCSPLDYVKLCICGAVDSGKTTLRELLEKSNLQIMLGRGLESNESSENGKKHTYGIDTLQLQLSNKDSTFNVWDFSGAVDNYVTHSYFLTTERTAYLLLLDLTKPSDKLKQELEEWLMLIKNHNIGSRIVYCANRRHPDIVPFSDKGTILRSKLIADRARASTVSHPTKIRDRLYSGTLRPPKLSRSTSPIRSRSTNVQLQSTGDLLSPIKQVEAEIIPLIVQVPVVVVGTHFDCLQEKAKKDTVRLMTEIVLEASRKFQRSLNVIPQVFPISGGDKPSVSEVRYLKEQLSTVRSSIIEGSAGFPRVFDKVAKKIESMKLESPDKKMIEFSEFCEIIQSQVNRLLSEAQVAHILRHLNTIGMIVFIQPLNQWVFLDPTWLLKTLGHLLSPPTYPYHIPCKNGEVTRKMIQTCVPTCSDAHSLNVALKVIRNLELGYCTSNGGETYRLSSWSAVAPGTDHTSSLWTPDEKYIKYTGRQMHSCDKTDTLPIGLVSYLHSQIECIQLGKNVHTFNQGFVLDYVNYQCLVQVDSDNRFVNFIGRICNLDAAPSCMSLLDNAQHSVAKVCRIMCPAVFFEWSIIDPDDLKAHAPSFKTYPSSVVVNADRRGRSSIVVSDTSCATELPLNASVSEMMFLGDHDLMLKSTGLNVKVSYLDDHLFEKVNDLLTEDGIQPGWKHLAEHINLSEYIEYLEGEKQPARKLILKWGEKPRWTVNSLLYALQGIKRVDVYDYIRAKTNPKYEILNVT